MVSLTGTKELTSSSILFPCFLSMQSVPYFIAIIRYNKQVIGSFITVANQQIVCSNVLPFKYKSPNHFYICIMQFVFIAEKLVYFIILTCFATPALMSGTLCTIIFSESSFQKYIVSHPYSPFGIIHFNTFFIS